MKKTVVSNGTPEEWDPESLLLKSIKYVQRMHEDGVEDEYYSLFSSLALEHLSRACLANVSPALLAACNESNWSSLYHSLGFTPVEKKFSPRTLAITEVFKRLSQIFENFTPELESFCALHVGRRNAELHSGVSPFTALSLTTWQPKYFRACQVLLQTIGLELDDYLGADEAGVALQLIASDKDESAKAVQKDIAAHKTVWLAKSEEDREKASNAAKTWATKQFGHRVKCPSCENVALVYGDPSAPPQKRLESDMILESQDHLPRSFECIACGLKIVGLPKLIVAGVGEKYKKTSTYDAADYYAPEDVFNPFEDDNNEPF